MFEPPGLQQWIERVWYSSGRLEHRRERVLPSASCDIIVNMGDPIRIVEGSGISRVVGTNVGGMLLRPILLEHPVLHETVGIQVTPLGMHAILGIPGACVANMNLLLTDVLDAPIDELANRCSDATRPWGVLQTTTQWAWARIVRFADRIDPIVQWASGVIKETHGAIDIRRLTDNSGYGATRFNQRFVAELGLTPKKFARLVRFRAALDRLDHDVSLADLALELGYSDQAHMNRDFRQLGETTPTEVLATRYPSGVTLAE